MIRQQKSISTLALASALITSCLQKTRTTRCGQAAVDRSLAGLIQRNISKRVMRSHLRVGLRSSSTQTAMANAMSMWNLISQSTPQRISVSLADFTLSLQRLTVQSGDRLLDIRE